jgi:hypothetical protein
VLWPALEELEPLPVVPKLLATLTPVEFEEPLELDD